MNKITNKNPTILGDKKPRNSRILIEFLFFVFLLCLGNPINILELKFTCFIISLVIITARYSLKDIYRSINPPNKRIIWAYYLVLIMTGFQHYFDLKPNILRPARYSIYLYCYGVTTSYEGHGEKVVSIAHIIDKGPYNIKETNDYDGSDQIPNEIEGEELDEVDRLNFFFFECCNPNSSFYYEVIETIIRCVIPDFLLMCLLLCIFCFFSEESRYFLHDFSKCLCAHTSRNFRILFLWIFRRIFLRILIPLYILVLPIKFSSFWLIIVYIVLFAAFIKIKKFIRLKSLRDKGYCIQKFFGEYTYFEPSQSGFVSVTIPTEFTLSGNKILVIPSREQWINICSYGYSWALDRRDEIFYRIEKYWSKRKVKYPDDWPI